MSEMVERVARAMGRAAPEPLLPDEWENLARGAIEAMREPTEEMLASRFQFSPLAHPWDVRENRLSHWQAMIDEALK